METAFAITGLVLLVAVLALTGTVVRLRQLLRHQETRAAQLEADLAAALKPPPPRTTVTRYARRMLRTADKVRTQGISGLIQATIDDLQTWAGSGERDEIVHMAASDGTVTLFFSDIENSTALNEALGDATWVKVLAAHDTIVRGRIGRYRGQVVKTAGDGFMAAFRDPDAACRAALGIQRELVRGRNATLRRHGPLRVRIGVHTGQVVAKDGDYFGTNVAMAARVADLASGGEVLASDAVVDALGNDDTDDGTRTDAVAFTEAYDAAELKGLPGEHLIWRVTSRT